MFTVSILPSLHFSVFYNLTSITTNTLELLFTKSPLSSLLIKSLKLFTFYVSDFSAVSKTIDYLFLFFFFSFPPSPQYYCLNLGLILAKAGTLPLELLLQTFFGFSYFSDKVLHFCPALPQTMTHLPLPPSS
jgi:hypothetical protein